MQENKITLDISYQSIAKVFIALFLLWFAYYLREIIFILSLSIILALIIVPAVDILEKKKIPRIIGSIVLFSMIFLTIGFILLIIAPPLAGQLSQLASYIPQFISDNSFFIDQKLLRSEFSGPLQNLLVEASGYFKNITSSLFSGIFSVLGGVLSFLMIIVISFYLVIEENGVQRFVKEAIPKSFEVRAIRVIKKIQLKLGRWFLGQIALGFIVGTMSVIGLYFLGIPYFLVLGIIAGFLELIPYLGPTLSAIPAIIIAFTVSPWHAFLTLILYFFIQQFENYLIVPKVMERSVNLHPIVIIMVIIIGEQLAGIPGAIIAVPVATIISIIFEDFNNNKSQTG
ncbi:MAG: AI-2E family transporter [Minisyncoccia bacterium]